MDFKESTDRLFACGVTAADIAKATGLKPNTILRMRLDPATPSYRSPPDDWPELLARVARKHVLDLDSCSADLKALADELESQR